MFKIIPEWQRRLKLLGISLSEICRQTGSDRKTVERLKERIPTSLKNYIKIEKRLTELEAIKAKEEKAKK